MPIPPNVEELLSALTVQLDAIRSGEPVDRAVAAKRAHAQEEHTRRERERVMPAAHFLEAWLRGEEVAQLLARAQAVDLVEVTVLGPVGSDGRDASGGKNSSYVAVERGASLCLATKVGPPMFSYSWRCRAASAIAGTLGLRIATRLEQEIRDGRVWVTIANDLEAKLKLRDRFGGMLRRF